MFNKPNTIWTQEPAWLRMANEIRTLRQEYQKAVPLMTPYERQKYGGLLRERIEQYYPTVLQGAKQHLEAQIERLKSADNGYRAAVQREIASWDTAKLNAEMTYYRQRIESALKTVSSPGFDRASTVDRLRQLWSEAQASGSREKIRALFEVLHDLSASENAPTEVRVLVREIQPAYEQVRTTADIDRAAGDRAMAAETLRREANALREVVKAFEWPDFQDPLKPPFHPVDLERLLRRVGEDEQGRPVVFDETSPQVTGIDWSAVDWGAVPDYTELP